MQPRRQIVGGGKALGIISVDMPGRADLARKKLGGQRAFPGPRRPGDDPHGFVGAHGWIYTRSAPGWTMVFCQRLNL